VVCVVLAVLTAWNLWLIDSLLLRWGMCALVVIPTALVLLRSVSGGDIKRLLKRN
jgi:hypothetical protein